MNPTPAARGWLVAPWFDLLFLANVAWPLAAAAAVWDGARPGLSFWQIYYVTTPHRWVTLVLVFADRDRFRPRAGLFLAVAAGVAAVCLAVRFGTGALTCLMAVDYVWNAWHFAAQHHGVYRLYDRLADPGRTAGVWAEKWAMRAFLLYVILRVATSTWPGGEVEDGFRAADGAAAVVGVGLLAWGLWRAGPGSAGRTAYLVSMFGLYAALLWAVHDRRLGLVLALATASALFHAVEYLALVSWTVRRRHAALGDGVGVLAYLAPRWGAVLAVFMLVLGAGGWWLDTWFAETWLAVNVGVAFLHYAYDGLIWRRPRAG